MYDILFICSANVGRSQIAEAFYNHYTNSKRAISAAGIQDVRDKYKHPDRDIVKVMLEENLDISNNSVKLANPTMVELSKKVILFCDPNSCPFYLRDNPKVQYIQVKDPYMPGEMQGLGIKRFRETKDEIKKIILSLLKK